MNKLLLTGRICFAIGILALGIVQFIVGDFVVGRPPAWPANTPGQLVWAYMSGAILVATGIAVLIRSAGITAISSRAVIGMLFFSAAIVFLYSAFPLLPELARELLKGAFPANVYKALALFGGILIMAASFYDDKKPGEKYPSSFSLELTGRILLAIFFIVCGMLHIMFFDFVKDFIPPYIPLRPFWTYLTAIALIASGIGLVINKTARLTAILCGTMIFLWFILLHIPRAVGTPEVRDEWLGVFESLAISGMLFTLAGSQSRRSAGIGLSPLPVV